MPGRPLTLCALAAAVLAGCGSETVHELPPAAEPPRSPVPARAAAGTLIHVGPGPEGVVVDARSDTAAVALRDPDELAIVSLRTRRVLRRVALPGAPRHLALQGHDALVPAETASRFLRVALPSGRVVARARTGAYPHDLTGAAGGRVLVGDERGSSLTLIERGRAVRSVPIAAQPGGLASLHGGRLVVVVSVRERVLELYDARTLKRLARVPAGVGPTHVACRDRGPCFVLDTQGNALLVFRVTADSLRLTRRVYMPGGPYGIAVDDRRGRLWVTTPGTNELAELPAHGRPHVIARRPTVRQPDSVAVDARDGSVVITGRSAGVLQVLAAPAR